MTTAPSSRALGRGVSQLIPSSTVTTPANQASAALAALRPVPVHIGVLQAAVVLLEDTEQRAEDEGTLAATRETVTLLRAAMDRGVESVEDDTR
ncbi:hypothetical protein [Streptomyces zagrosensis]|uniref:Uncharacterized protein n=1 Tax=Streptomyces zagrosensis TaxID=1042984 RepID=A0A7W9QF88_9ACTN|nr:hypothetical protein [Streptomyces zagrosensis]MBB5938623.1 hypothetical protein [Streptomyces zagrosensis]